MLTPSFDIRQDDEFVILDIKVPYVKIAEADFYISGHEFKFYCKPYFLRLNLPGEIVEDGRERAKYDIDSATVVVHLPKRNRGEYFENLGMITALLSKRKTASLAGATNRPLIEVVGDTPHKEVDGACAGPPPQCEEEFDWQTDQSLPQDDEDCPSVGSVEGYGFAGLYHGVFSKLQEEIPSIVDCPQPDHMTPQERRLARIAHEEASFSPDHYLADLMDSEPLEDALKFTPPWKDELKKWENLRTQTPDSVDTREYLPEPQEEVLPFTTKEREQLKELPNKEFLLDAPTRKALYLGLVDIIFAVAYDYRTTEGEPTVESAWTICKLSSTLSWLEVFQGSVEEVVFCSLRRSLCYPLYRHWQLATAVLQDTRDIFHLGRRKLLQCLLSVHQTLNSSEPYYILNNLYLTDYCVWIQTASSKHICEIATQLNQVKMEKCDMGWGLVELEQAAYMVLDSSSSESEEEDDEDEEDEVEEDSAEEGGRVGEKDVQRLESTGELQSDSCLHGVPDCSPRNGDNEMEKNNLNDTNSESAVRPQELSLDSSPTNSIQELGLALSDLVLEPPTGNGHKATPLIEEIPPKLL